MRIVIAAAICLSLIVCVTANDLSAGKREAGDSLVASRRLLRPAVPTSPRMAITGYNSKTLVITAVNAKNAVGSDAKVSIVKGGPGNTSVLVLAASKPGAGIDVQVEIYAKPIPPSPTPSPTPTAAPIMDDEQDNFEGFF